MSQLHVVTNESAHLEAMKDAFPDVDPQFRPFGGRVLVQVRRAPQKSKGGIALPDEAKSNEQWNASVAKVLAVGPLAFKKRDTMADWPEGVWASVGDFVRAPRYGGDRWEIAISDGSKVLVAVFNDHELIGRIEGDPLSMRGYV